MNNKGIIVGVDNTTKEEVLLSEADRRKHLMVIGPSGSGKTSQSITPFIAQDLQNENMGITLIEPRSDLAQRVNEMAKHYGRKTFFFEINSNSNAIPNPLKGDTAAVINNFVLAYNTIANDCPTFFLNIGKELIKGAITVLKTVIGEETNLVEFNKFIHNTGGYGMETIEKFSYLTAFSTDHGQNIIEWFKSEYFVENSKLYEFCSDFRAIVNDLIEVYGLTEKMDIKEMDFEKHLEDGDVVIISTNAANMGAGFSLFNQLISLSFQSAIFRNKRHVSAESKLNAVYIDEAHMYVNSNFIHLVQQGISCNVILHLAVQTKKMFSIGLMGTDIGPIKGIEAICSNIQNVIIYPGVDISEAAYYSKQFGEVDGKAVITATDIICRKFGEATFVLTKDGKLQKPIVLKNKYVTFNT